MTTDTTLSCLRCGAITTYDTAGIRADETLCCPQCGGDLIAWKMPAVDLAELKR